VQVLAHRFVGRQFFQPALEILVQPGFIVIDKDGGSYVHRIYQYQSFLDATFRQAGFYLAGDIDETPACWDMEPQLFSITFHLTSIIHGIEALPSCNPACDLHNTLRVIYILTKNYTL
jgi:hypothetical protein